MPCNNCSDLARCDRLGLCQGHAKKVLVHGRPSSNVSSRTCWLRARIVVVAVGALTVGVVAGYRHARHEVRSSCDIHAAMKIDQDVYECRRERGIS